MPTLIQTMKVNIMSMNINQGRPYVSQLQAHQPQQQDQNVRTHVRNAETEIQNVIRNLETELKNAELNGKNNAQVVAAALGGLGEAFEKFFVQLLAAIEKLATEMKSSGAGNEGAARQSQQAEQSPEQVGGQGKLVGSVEQLMELVKAMVGVYSAKPAEYGSTGGPPENKGAKDLNEIGHETKDYGGADGSGMERIMGMLMQLLGTAPGGEDDKPEVTLQDMEKYFDVEGDSPMKGVGKMVFDAMESQAITPNGNGIRNEVKIKEELRAPSSQTLENFSAKITPEFSAGSQAIVAQTHGEDGVPFKLYVDDQDNGKSSNGVAGDGEFDVYAKYTDDSGKEQTIEFGSIKKGESLDVDLKMDHGEYELSVNGQKESFDVADDGDAYFKFGSYLQTKDPITGEKAKPLEGGMEILERNNITEGQVTFEGVNYSREVDK